jgi:hypothetical protein
MVVGGSTPRYVRLRPRLSLAAILDDRGSQPLPERVNGLISKVTVETLNLRPNMLVNALRPSPCVKRRTSMLCPARVRQGTLN